MTFLVGIALVFFACNSGNKESLEVNSENANEKISNTDNNRSYDCLKKFQDDYGLLLTEEEIASVYPIDFAIAKKELRSGSYGEYIYQWPSDRPTFTVEVSGMKMEIPDANILGIKMLSFSSDDSELKSVKETFNMGYKELSDKELEKIQDNLDKQNEDTKKTGENLMKVRAKMKFEFVDGIGSSAWYKWNENYGGELAVLAGRATFNIVAKISDDPEENKELAKKLAEKVISKCK